MNRNSRRTLLTLAMIGISGCAQSDYPLSAHSRKPSANDPRRKSHIREEEPPKILPETFFAAAQLLERQGQFEEAIRQYRKAVAVNHDYVAAHHRLGLLLSLTGRRDEALQSLQRAVALGGSNPVLRNNLGYEYMFHDRWADAEREFARSHELDPEFVRPYINRGLALGKLGRFDEALKSFQAVLAEPDAYYNLGLIYRAHKRYREAAETFNRVLTINPEFIAARRQLEQLAPRLEALHGVEPVVAAVVEQPFPSLIAIEESRASSESPWTEVSPMIPRTFAAQPEEVVQFEERTHESRMEFSPSRGALDGQWPVESGRSVSHSTNRTDAISEMSFVPTPLQTDFTDGVYSGPPSAREVSASLAIVQNEIRCLESLVDEDGLFETTASTSDTWAEFQNESRSEDFASPAFPVVESAADSFTGDPSTTMQDSTIGRTHRTLGMTVIEVVRPQSPSGSESLYDNGGSKDSTVPFFASPTEEVVGPPQAPRKFEPSGRSSWLQFSDPILPAEEHGAQAVKSVSMGNPASESSAALCAMPVHWQAWLYSLSIETRADAEAAVKYEPLRFQPITESATELAHAVEGNSSRRKSAPD